jgi:hypothetical protein
MRRIGFALIGLVAGAASAADEPVAFSCRAQIVYDCTRDCTQNTMPADLQLDIKAGRGSFCRGSRCDEGALVVSEAKGQWDDALYRIFRLDLTAAGWEPVTGVVHGNVFHAESKGFGSMAGTCEAGAG